MTLTSLLAGPRRPAALLAAAAAWAGAAFADSWVAPHEQDYYSSARAYYLHVVPGDGVSRARGTLFGVACDAPVIWSRELENENAPVTVLVADDGRYVVTCDEWGRVGWGPNVVVIYGPGGELIKKFALEDLLTPEEVAAVPATVSSRWWGGEHYLDEAAGEVVLRVATGAGDAGGKPTFRERRIKLATGEVVKR